MYEGEIVSILKKLTNLWFKSKIVLKFTNDISPEWHILVYHYTKSGISKPDIYTEKNRDLGEILKTVDSRIRAGKADSKGDKDG